MPRKILAATVLLSLASLLAFAQGAAKTVKLKGYLIDNMCAKDGDDADDAAGHPTACAAMPNCAASGFALVEGKKLYKLDDAGNKLAADVIKETKTKKGLTVEAEGTLDGATLHVTKLSEVAAQ